MTIYTLVFIRDGKPAGQTDCSCGDDLDALDTGLKLCFDQSVEVYDDTRLVARIKQGEEALL